MVNKIPSASFWRLCSQLDLVGLSLDPYKKIFDDIGIRKHVDLLRNGTIVGYPDFGDEAAFVNLGGGNTTTPASHVMVFMITAINDHFKLPCAWFALSDNFSGKHKSLFTLNIINFITYNRQGFFCENYILFDC